MGRRSGVVRLAPYREHWLEITTRGLREDDFIDFKRLACEFGVMFDAPTKLRTVERPQAGALARFLRRRGYRVDLAPELEDEAADAIRSLHDLVELGRAVFCSRLGVGEARGAEAHVLDVIDLPLAQCARLERRVLGEVAAVAIALADRAGVAYPRLRDQARALTEKCREALAIAAKIPASASGAAQELQVPDPPAPPPGSPLERKTA